MSRSFQGSVVLSMGRPDCRLIGDIDECKICEISQISSKHAQSILFFREKFSIFAERYPEVFEMLKIPAAIRGPCHFYPYPFFQGLFIAFFYSRKTPFRWLFAKYLFIKKLPNSLQFAERSQNNHLFGRGQVIVEKLFA